jgi:hypothetical protein
MRRSLIVLALLALAGAAAWEIFSGAWETHSAQLVLSIEKLMYPPDDARLISSTRKLALLYLRHGQQRAAAKQLEESVRLLILSGKQTTPELADLYDRLADCYSHQAGQQSMAAKYAVKAGKAYRQIAGELFDRKQFDSAINYFENAEFCFEKALPESAYDAAFLMRHLGNLLYVRSTKNGRKQDLMQAKSFYERSVSLWDRAEHPDKAQLALTLCGLGNASTSLDLFPDAEKAFVRSLSISRQVPDLSAADRTTIVGSIENCAAACFKKSNYAVSERMWMLALAGRQTEIHPSGQAVAASLYGLACCLFCERKYSEANRAYNKTLALQEKLVGPNDPSVGIALASLGQCELAQSQYSQAVNHFVRSIALLKGAGKLATVHLKLAFDGYAEALEKLGRRTEAKQIREEAKQ